ncbi:MAG: TIGR04100 family radical SAM protein [Erysipelotrichaceae bacterium]|nr:TIGR04100 family radical SAM protein [Erysipelotrichaceae bacterium]
MEIVYKVHNGLYVNLTNRCPYGCTFCLRQTMDRVGESDSLWLEREPSVEEVKAAFSKWDINAFDEIVFCGFGEPTERFDDLMEVAKWLKANYDKPIRINTNGVANLINGRDVIPEMKGYIDTVSISLNNPHKEDYAKLVRSKFGPDSFDAMLDFAKECVDYIPNVVLTTVDTTITKEEEEECAAICEKIGAKYRIRPWEE